METKNKDYIVKAKFIFEGEMKVYASSKDEAKQMVRDNFGMTFGKVQSTVPNILDWNINMKPTKIVK